ncbi:AraC family transcriptional regulator [Caldimonas brevitalea]|uniref:HTH AraC-type regulator n=1 Tax=Caldimonas brevitalea TaxID=413882 RepID=A8KCK0_9BURK|nr:AraC family transcriptional regulator [Caldimonas brevitalea]AKJ29069.1 transcriptional regulator, AraC family [Caldimonas brevitalea]CAL80832.1 HTH AraC-type regulator [Caldimonas brevitalea]
MEKQDQVQTNNAALPSLEVNAVKDNVRVSELARLLNQHAPRKGVGATAIPRLSVIKLSTPSDELVHALHEPAVCIIAQGAKRVMLRDEVYCYDTSRFLVFSTDLPISAQVTDATFERPYLCFRLDLDPKEVSELVLQLGAPPATRNATSRGLFLSAATDAMLDAAVRLLRLLDTPEDVPALAPLATRELVYRLLKSEQGERLAQVARADSPGHRVTRAIAWLKANYAEPLKVDELARCCCMSTSSLHHHFRVLTSMSPLQYQKQLRLQEARRLMLSEGIEVSKAAYTVGYESASQFSREYSRLYGIAPSKDTWPLGASAQGT